MHITHLSTSTAERPESLFARSCHAIGAVVSFTVLFAVLALAGLAFWLVACSDSQDDDEAYL